MILSGEVLLCDMGWPEAADLMITGMENAIAAKMVTYDIRRLKTDAKLFKCRAFGNALIDRLG